MDLKSARIQWRRFAFFDKDVISEDIEAKVGKVTCASSEGGSLLFGDATGHIYIADRNLQLGEHKHKVFRGEVKGLRYLFDPQNHKKQFVVSVGDDSRPRTTADGTVIPNITASYVVKIFSVNDMSRPMNAFLAAPGIDTHSVLTAFAVTADATQIALGFSNRMILLFNGNFLKEGAMLRQVPPEIILPPRGALIPVTGLHFCEITSRGEGARGAGTVAEAKGTTEEDGGTNIITRRTHLYAVIDIDAAVAAAADANSAPDYFAEDKNDDNIRLLYPGVFGNPRNMGGVNKDGSPLSAGEVLDLAEGGVFAFDTSINVKTNASTGTVVVTSRASERRSVNVLDSRGGALYCSSLMPATAELLVGRAEGVFTYSIDDRGAAAGFEGDKQCICTVGNYVLVATGDLKSRRTNIAVYDLRHKFISMSSQLLPGERVNVVSNDGGTVYLLTTNNSLIRFREKGTSAKLEVLLRKNLFPLAITIAAEEHSGVRDIMRLYRQYADYAYNKEEYENAALQYSYTIGYVPSSYVIRRFLEPTLVAHLVFYLEKLRERGMATDDHAKILLLAYVKTGDRPAILRFIYTCCNPPTPTAFSAAGTVSTTAGVPMPSSSPLPTAGDRPGATTSHKDKEEEEEEEAIKRECASKGGFIDFQADACVSMLRDANLLDFALKLAQVWGKHATIIGILLEKLNSETSTHQTGRILDTSAGNAPAREVMTTLAEMALILPAQDLIDVIGTHGAALLAQDPATSTALFVKICTGELEQLSTTTGGPSSKQRDMLDNRDVEVVARVYGGNHREHLLKLLTAVLEQRKRNSRSGKRFSPLLSETLLELCLEQFCTAKRSFDAALALVDAGDRANPHKWPESTRQLQEKMAHEEKTVMGVLDGSHTETYDTSQALLLAHDNDCEAAQRFILEKFEAVDTLLMKHIEAEDERGILRLLRREGKKDTDLYFQVLNYFVQRTMAEPEDSDEEEGRWDAVSQVLGLVKQDTRIPHMQILSILSKNPKLPLSVVKGYIEKHLVSTREEVSILEERVVATAETLSALENNRERAASKLAAEGFSGANADAGERTETSASSNTALRGQKSQASAGEEEDPIDDFASPDDMSFEDDFYESEDEVDPSSSQSASDLSISVREKSLLEEQESSIERERWERIRALSAKRSHEHEAFYAELEASEDGFATVAAAFGKTIMTPSPGM